MHAVVWNGRGPKQTLLVDSRIEIVDLLGIRIRSRTREDIQSHKSERAVVNFAVTPDKDSGHEAVVGIEKQMTCPPAWFFAGSSAAHVCESHETVEIGDRNGLTRRAWKKQMEERALGSKQLQATRNWLGQMGFFCRMRQWRCGQTCDG